MEYLKLNTDWNADPNAPDEEFRVEGSDVYLQFYLNYFVYDAIEEGQKGELHFMNCVKYSTTGTNDEGYHREQHRYRQSVLPWGEFYELKTDWKTDFAPDAQVLSEVSTQENLKHYIFFMKECTFECVAEGNEFR